MDDLRKVTMHSSSQRDPYYEPRRQRYDRHDSQRSIENRSDAQEYFRGHSHYVNHDSFEDRRNNDRYSGHSSQSHAPRSSSNRYYDNSESQQYYNPRERSQFEQLGSREKSPMEALPRKSALSAEKIVCELIQDEHLHNPPIEINAPPYFSYPETWD